MVKGVKGVRYIWILRKKLILTNFRTFCYPLKYTPFGTFFTLFFLGDGKTCVWSLSPINGFKIHPKAKAACRSKNFVSRIRPKSDNLAIFAILDRAIDFEAGYGAMDTKNEVRISNYLFF